MSGSVCCRCALCQHDPGHSEAALHRHLNLFLSHLDERRRRWFAGLEALRRGRGGTQEVAQITGLDEKTIRRGRQEIRQGLLEGPSDRVRRSGGGRKAVEKKALQSS